VIRLAIIAAVLSFRRHRIRDLDVRAPYGPLRRFGGSAVASVQGPCRRYPRLSAEGGLPSRVIPLRRRAPPLPKPRTVTGRYRGPIPGLQKRKETVMIIGNFTCNEARDTYTGELSTLTVAARKVVFQPSEARGDKAPSHRVVSSGKTGFVELGAAWKKRSEEGRDFGQARRSEPGAAAQLRPGRVKRRRGLHPRLVARPASVVRRAAARGGGVGRSARAASFVLGVCDK